MGDPRFVSWSLTDSGGLWTDKDNNSLSALGPVSSGHSKMFDDSRNTTHLGGTCTLDIYHMYPHRLFIASLCHAKAKTTLQRLGHPDIRAGLDVGGRLHHGLGRRCRDCEHGRRSSGERRCSLVVLRCCARHDLCQVGRLGDRPRCWPCRARRPGRWHHGLISHC